MKKTYRRLAAILISIYIFTIPVKSQEPININFSMPKPLQFRWVLINGYWHKKSENVDIIKNLIERAADSEFNGIVLNNWALTVMEDVYNNEKSKELKEIIKKCDKENIELIPVFGYRIFEYYQPNFMAGKKITLKLVAEEKKLVPLQPIIKIENCDLENYNIQNGRFDYYFQDKPYQVSYIDTTEFISGSTSVRLENFSTNRGHGRISQQIVVSPGYEYKLEAYVKSNNFTGTFGLQVYEWKNNNLGIRIINKSYENITTNNWQKVSVNFISNTDSIRIYSGIWNGQSGKVWIDSINVTPTDHTNVNTLSNIVRKKSTPIKLFQNNKTYIENIDYKTIKNLKSLDSIALTENTTIMTGDTLTFEFYKTVDNSERIGICFSNNEMYEYTAKQIENFYNNFYKFNHAYIWNDEYRSPCQCEDCIGKKQGELFGQYHIRIDSICKNLNPQINIIGWADMIDPTHNAKENYYGSDFSDSWRYIPKDMILVPWGEYWNNRKEGVQFLSNKNFKIIGGCYYNSENLESSQVWQNGIFRIKNGVGLMYTTFSKKYEIMNEFGKMMMGQN